MNPKRRQPLRSFLKLYRRCRYEAAELRRYWHARWRKEWPPDTAAGNRIPRAAIIVASYNTAQLLSYLVFSAHRILGRSEFTDLVIVDNASSDGSREILAALDRAGLVKAIFNQRQTYHAPALNQAMAYLVERYAACAPADRPDYILTLDSDIVVLRQDLIRDAASALRGANAVLAGQYESNTVVNGYAHISCMLMDPTRVWRRGIPQFENDGTPAEQLQRGLEQRGLRRLNFRFRSDAYVLHFGRGTLRQVFLEGDRRNEYYAWAVQKHDYDALRDPFYRRLFEEFLAVYTSEVDGSPASLVAACEKSALIKLRRPTEFDYLGYHRDVPKAPEDTVSEAECIADGWL